MPRIIAVLLLGAALLGAGPVHAEMLQFATPDGVKSWPKLPDIPDWHQDQGIQPEAGRQFIDP